MNQIPEYGPRVLACFKALASGLDALKPEKTTGASGEYTKAKIDLRLEKRHWIERSVLVTFLAHQHGSDQVFCPAYTHCRRAAKLKILCIPLRAASLSLWARGRLTLKGRSQSRPLLALEKERQTPTANGLSFRSSFTSNAWYTSDRFIPITV